MKRFLVIAAVIVAVAGAGIYYLLHPYMFSKPLPVKKDDPWILQSNDPKEKYGTYLGNGYISARIGADGTGQFIRFSDDQPNPVTASAPSFMSGLYDGESFLPLPDWGGVQFFTSPGSSYKFDPNAPYRQTLNMREGYVSTEMMSGTALSRSKLTVTTFVPMQKLNNGAQAIVVHYDVEPQGMIDPKFASGYCSSVNDGWALTRVDDVNISLFTTKKSGGVAMAASTLTPQGRWSSGYFSTRPQKDGNTISATRYVVVACGSSARQSALDAIRSLGKTGYNKLFEDHKRAWRERWKSDIVIDGDPKAQQAVHAMMFYLTSSASPDYSITPLGLSGAGWNGHIFWDADTWMFPSLMLQHPDLAEGIVNYRIKTLNGAKANAAARKMAGVEFAWESAATGKETAPNPYHEERHITADVALAARFYPEKALDLINQTAAYWASRVTYNKAKDRYEILNSMPPDEDAGVVNNSVYTNVAAKQNLESAVEVCKKLGKSYPRKWEEIAAKMYIPFDARNQRFLGYDGYKGGQTKQADTELLIYPLMHPMSATVKRNTFDFYKKTTNPRGPAMTSSIHSIIAAELGRSDEAYQLFDESYKPFMRGPFLMFNEKRSKTYENMCFVTGCGGTLQSVIYGFAGLRVGKNPGGFNELMPGLYIKPCLPKQWNKLEITNIHWNGKTFDLLVLPGNKWQVKNLR